MKKLIVLVAASLLVILTSCENGAKSPRGFSLPAGDAEAGKVVFMKYECLTCHTVKGLEQAGIEKHPNINVKLGGKSSVVKTYGELVTSVINPSHKLATRHPIGMIQDRGESKMKVFNDVMTVTELVNLVEFLQTKYEITPYRRTNYNYYDTKRNQ